jgi:hypothetical protein
MVEVKAEQSPNAANLISVAPSGMTMEESLLHSKKVSSSILVIPEGRAMGGGGGKSDAGKCHILYVSDLVGDMDCGKRRTA